ncbi:prolyl oligopeptidase family serine peptidase [Eisenbergiella tayi]|uniref:prolyl oligopeptidase family serine peptidase n=1 Tax=Eisenbergiella tayi TaxID=1432052 RepID=UPI0009BDB6DB|nr:prolyl oligopeptidase family serine peptidase [Eisenbergiella tayi]
MNFISMLLTFSILCSGCGSFHSDDSATHPAENPSKDIPTEQGLVEQEVDTSLDTGFMIDQILKSTDGAIHYSYYLPESYDGIRTYPMVVAMPGYYMMWFGEESSGSNVEWTGVQAWTEMDEEIVVVSAQLTDWGETSARQAIELTEYFLDNFAINRNRVYAAGYSAGGETMSRAVSMRPDLYAAYLHGASQWDGTYAPIADNRVAVYIYMAENDEYYGSEKARNAYNNLRNAYQQAGVTDEQLDLLLQLEIPDNEHFNRLGIYNYHDGGNIMFDDKTILDWIIQKEK